MISVTAVTSVTRATRLLAACALVLPVLLGCGGDEAPEPDPARLVVVDLVVAEDAVDRLVLLGDVHGEVEVRVVPQLPERIRVLHVEEGSEVAVGDPIATLSAELPSSDVAQAGAALSVAETNRDRLRDEVARIEPLVAQGVMARTTLDQLRSQLRAANGQVTQLTAGRRAAGVRRARTVVRAPAAGQVALLRVAEGDMVAPGVPLATVVQTERVEVRLQVVESDYVRLREGMQVEVRPIALDEVHRVGTITSISPVIDRMTRTAAVVVSVDNADHVLRPGMVSEVAIELERRPDVLMVPSRSIVMTTRTDETREAAIFVVVGGAAERRAVQLGRRYGHRLEVVEGLSHGERVVVEGQHLLRNGSPVRTPPEVTAQVSPTMDEASAPAPEEAEEAEGQAQ